MSVLGKKALSRRAGREVLVVEADAAECRIDGRCVVGLAFVARENIAARCGLHVAVDVCEAGFSCIRREVDAGVILLGITDRSARVFVSERVCGARPPDPVLIERGPDPPRRIYDRAVALLRQHDGVGGHRNGGLGDATYGELGGTPSRVATDASDDVIRGSVGALDVAEGRGNLGRAVQTGLHDAVVLRVRVDQLVPRRAAPLGIVTCAGSPRRAVAVHGATLGEDVVIVP